MRPVRATLTAPCPPEALFRWVEDLAQYPPWLDLVRRAEPLGEDRWSVVIAARMGPLRRSKQLTMRRTECQAPTSVRFERDEQDGRQHAAWVLEATVAPAPEGAELTMTMTYDGQLWGPVIERVLVDEIARARPRLAALATG